MAYGKHNKVYPDPTPKKVDGPAQPAHPVPANAGGAPGKYATKSSIPPIGGSRAGGPRGAAQPFNAPSGPTSQPGRTR